MEYAIIELIRIFAVSLGVGTATVGLAHILLARVDRFISEEERPFLRVDQITLKIAFFLLLFSQLAVSIMELPVLVSTFSVQTQALWVLTSALFIAMVFGSFGVVRESEAIAVQVALWYGSLFILFIPQVLPVNLPMFYFTLTLFALFTLYLLQRTRHHLRLTHNFHEKSQNTN